MQIAITVDDHERLEPHMRRLSLMIPDNTLVLAAKYYQVRDFGRTVLKKLIFIDDHTRIQGLENQLILKIGNYWEHPDYYRIQSILACRRGMMYMEIPDWR